MSWDWGRLSPQLACIWYPISSPWDIPAGMHETELYTRQPFSQEIASTTEHIKNILYKNVKYHQATYWYVTWSKANGKQNGVKSM